MTLTKEMIKSALDDFFAAKQKFMPNGELIEDNWYNFEELLSIEKCDILAEKLNNIRYIDPFIEEDYKFIKQTTYNILESMSDDEEAFYDYELAYFQGYNEAGIDYFDEFKESGYLSYEVEVNFPEDQFNAYLKALEMAFRSKIDSPESIISINYIINIIDSLNVREWIYDRNNKKINNIVDTFRYYTLYNFDSGSGNDNENENENELNDSYSFTGSQKKYIVNLYRLMMLIDKAIEEANERARQAEEERWDEMWEKHPEYFDDQPLSSSSDKHYPDWLGGMEAEEDFWEHE